MTERGQECNNAEESFISDTSRYLFRKRILASRRSLMTHMSVYVSITQKTEIEISQIYKRTFIIVKVIFVHNYSLL
jgi:hypothetical protein